MMVLFNKPAIAIDTETTGLHPFHGCKPFAVSMCDWKGKTWFYEWPVDPYTRQPKIPSKDIQSIRRLINGYKLWVFHHAKFDIRMLSTIGVDCFTRFDKVHDTLIMSHLVNSNEEHGLKALAHKYCGIPVDDEAELKAAVLKAARFGAKQDPPWSLGHNLDGDRETCYDYWAPKAMDPKSEVLETYAVTDAIRTMRLFLMFAEHLKQEPAKLKFYERERALLPEVYNMETVGVCLDRDRVVVKTTEAVRMKDDSLKAMRKAAGLVLPRKEAEVFNPNSSPQLNRLAEAFQLDNPWVTESGGMSFDKDAMEWLILQGTTKRYPKAGRRFIEGLAQYKKFEGVHKIVRKYQAHALQVTLQKVHLMELHSTFSQTGTSTTRFSSSGPPLQNVEKRKKMGIRGCFRPRPGWFWIDSDYKNLEMMLFAWRADDKELQEYFLAGKNVHALICSRLYGVKYNVVADNCEDPSSIWFNRYLMTKNGNFALIYGAQCETADRTYGVPGAYSKIRCTFPKIDAFLSWSSQFARKHGFVETMFGYRLVVPKFKPHAACNYIIQGTAGDILKYGWLNLRANGVLSDTCRMLMTIHDEIVLEVKGKPDRKIKPLVHSIQQAMEEPGSRIGVPIKCSVDIVESAWNDKGHVDDYLAS